MKKKALRKELVICIGILTVFIASITMVVSCSPAAPEESGDPSGSFAPENVGVGEYETIKEADMLADGTNGTAFHKGGDEELQQDRITGGANTGGVSSENLEPIDTGAIDPKDHDNPAPDLLEIGYPQQIPHSLSGRDDCVSCHGSDTAERPLPQNHVDAALTSDYCQVCHKEAM